MDVLKVIEQQKKVYLNLGLINKLMELREVEKMLLEEQKQNKLDQNLSHGLAIRGEKAQGIEVSIRSKPMLYQIAKYLNFVWFVDAFFDLFGANCDEYDSNYHCKDVFHSKKSDFPLF